MLLRRWDWHGKDMYTACNAVGHCHCLIGGKSFDLQSISHSKCVTKIGCDTLGS